MSDPTALAGGGPGEVIRHLPLAAMVVDAPSWRIAHVNARVRDGGAPARPDVPSELGFDWQVFHADGPPYEPEDWPLVRSLTAGEEVVNEEYLNVLADGGRLFVRCSSAPIYDDGEIVGGLLVMDDVAGQKRAEEERATVRVVWVRSCPRCGAPSGKGGSAATGRPSVAARAEPPHRLRPLNGMHPGTWNRWRLDRRSRAIASRR